MSARRRPARRAGFTLLEVLAVTVAASLTLAVAARFYLQSADASREAAARGGESRRALGVLDRLATDLAATALVTRPPDTDPLSWPWLFLATGRGGEGADHLKFQTRSRATTEPDSRTGDLATVSWWVAPAEDGSPTLTLWRQATPDLPAALDRDFPRRDAPGAEVVASGLEAFSVRLEDDTGALVDRWDSSTLERSDTVPVAVVIALRWPPEAGEVESEPYLRRVGLALRPFDLAAALAPEGAQNGANDDENADGEDANCVTVAECIDRNADAWQAFLASRPDRDALQAVVQSLANQCFSKQAANLGVALANCE